METFFLWNKIIDLFNDQKFSIPVFHKLLYYSLYDKWAILLKPEMVEKGKNINETFAGWELNGFWNYNLENCSNTKLNSLHSLRLKSFCQRFNTDFVQNGQKLRA